MASRLLLWAVILLPAVFGFLYVQFYGVNVPYTDNWSMVPFFEKLYSGELTAASIFGQHNEHRIVFPRLAILLLGTVTAFNDVANMYLIQVLLTVTLVTLLLAFRSSIGRDLLLFLPVPFLVFSLGQSWNMLQGFQVTLVLSQTSGVLAFYLLYVSRRSRRYAFPGALASGVVASFSAAPGVLVWPVGMLQVLLLPVERRVRRLLAGAWGLVGAAVGLAYFSGYETPGGQSSRYVLDYPAGAVEFFLVMLGGSLFWQNSFGWLSQGLPLAAGTVLVCAAAVGFILCYRARRLGEGSFWMALVLFSSLILAATALARGSEVENALNPKYVTYSVLAVVGTYALLVRSATERATPAASLPLGLLTVLVMVSIPLSYVEGIDRGEQIRANKEEAAFVLVTHNSRSDASLEEFFRTDPETSRERATVLQDLGYSVFSEESPQVSPPDPDSSPPVLGPV